MSRSKLVLCRLACVFVAASVVACDSPDPPAAGAPAAASTPSVEVTLPEAAAVKAQPSDEAGSAAAPTASQRIKEWKLTYSGDLSGELGGSMVVVARTGASSAIRARGGDARLSFSLNGDPDADDPAYEVLPLSATLADGTTCRMSNAAKVEVRANEKDHLDLTLSGEMKCGEGQVVTYEASVRRKQ